MANETPAQIDNQSPEEQLEKLYFRAKVVIFSLGALALLGAGYIGYKKGAEALVFSEPLPTDATLFENSNAAIRQSQDGSKKIEVKEGSVISDLDAACTTVFGQSATTFINMCEFDFWNLATDFGTAGPKQVVLKPDQDKYSQAQLETLLGTGYETRGTRADREATLLKLLYGTIGVTGGIGGLYVRKEILRRKKIKREADTLAWIDHRKKINELIRVTHANPFATDNDPRKLFPDGIPSPTKKQLAKNLRRVRKMYQTDDFYKGIKDSYNAVWLDCLETTFRYEEFLDEIERKMIIEDLMRLMDHMLKGEIVPQQLYYLQDVSKWFQDERKHF